MSSPPRRILLIDGDEVERELLAERLRAQGFFVETAHDGAHGAQIALASPPSTVVADLWMPGVSGVQLCRLLNAEPATADVPLILRSEHDDPKSRFWAERAGAIALVSKGRMGELVRVLKRALATAPVEGGFFIALGNAQDIRDRIAEHLDRALFESVIAAEIRALATASSFEWLFDAVSQLTAQLISYRWLALFAEDSARMGVHGHPSSIAEAEAEARQALSVGLAQHVHRVADKDAYPFDSGGPEWLIRDVPFGSSRIGRIAVAPTSSAHDAGALLDLVARELGGVIKIATLVENSRQLAMIDSLTNLMNRRAFLTATDGELTRCERTEQDFSVVLLDVDHFKQINDKRGHATGDIVLQALGQLLPGQCRRGDISARWGGEEFLLALPGAGREEAYVVAERVRCAIESAVIRGSDGEVVAVTASMGVAVRRRGETIDEMVDRADCAMYAAKTGGRNRVCFASSTDEAGLEVFFAPTATAAKAIMRELRRHR